MLISFFHRLLLLLPPESAHRVGMSGLRTWQWLRKRFLKKSFHNGRVLLLAPAPSLALRGRVGLAAGFDKNAEAFAGLLGLGFGFVEIGTVTPQAQSGNPKPRIWRVGEQGLINHLGFNSRGLNPFLMSIRRYRDAIPGGCLLANIGKNKLTPDEDALNDYMKCFDALKREVDGFVVNLSSPNTPGLRDLQSEKFLEKLAAIAPSDLPIFIKFAPDLDNAKLDALCSWICCESRFSGAVVTNTSRAIAQSKFARETGGYSGPLLFDRSLECVGIARKALGPKKILIGVGGVDSVQRAKAMREAGADLVEIYTAFIYRGPRFVKELMQLR